MATPMELETEEDKYLSVWDELGKHLDNDMPPDDLQQAMQLLRNILPSDFKTELPSDVLRFLQNNYPQGRALSRMKHVLRIMDSHHQGKTTWSHASLFEEYENKLKAFGKNETFVGRQEELNEILGMFSLSSEIKGFWIYGHGGMGKSTLANEVSWHICSTTDTELIQLNLSETSNFTDMLMDLKSGMRCYLSTESESNLVDEALNRVTNIKQDTLILFDNIEEVYFHNKEKLESFISKLMKRLKSSKFKVRTIFTARSPLKDLQPGTPEVLKSLHLQQLSIENANTMLRLLSKTGSTDDNQIAKILDSTELIPQRLALRHHSLSLPPALLCNFSNDVYRDVLCAFQHLNDARQKQLAALMIFDTSPFNDEDAKVALNEDIKEVFQSLFDLIDCHLIQERRQVENAEDKEWNIRFAYCIHLNVFNSLRKICDSQENEELKRCHREAHRRFSYKTVEMMEKNCKNFDMFYEKAVRFAWQSNTRMKVLLNFLSENHLDMSYEQFSCLKRIPPLIFSFEKRYEIIKKVATACKTQGNSALYCFWLLEIAILFVEMKEFGKAKDILEEVEETEPPTTKTQKTVVERVDEISPPIQNRNGDEKWETVENTSLPEMTVKSRTDAILKVEYYLTKGRTLRGLSDYNGAMQKQKAALKILEESAPDDIPRQAAVCNAIGNILHDLEEYDESGHYHQRAVDIMHGYIKGGPTLDMSVYLFNVGSVSTVRAGHMMSNKKEEALELLREALKYYTESIDFDIRLKLDSLNSHAEKLKIRASAYRDLRQFDNAIQDAKKSVKLKETLFPNGPWSSLILGYYQIGELYLKERQTLLRPKVAEAQAVDMAAPALISRNGDKLLNESMVWLTKAATLIKEKKENGLSPHHKESQNFVRIYKEVADRLHDKLGKEAEDFCSAFEAGRFVSSEPSSPDEDSSRSSSSSNSSDDIDKSHRKDSGMAGIDSDMDIEYTVGINTVEQPSKPEDDSVFEGQDDDFLPTRLIYKRKLSD